MTLGLVRRIGRLWRTVRWLRPVQVTGRLRFKLHKPRPDPRPAPPLRAAVGDWIRPPAREASLVAPDRLVLIGAEHALRDVGWDSEVVPLLWRYNLHYFDDLNAVGSAQRRPWQRDLVRRWLVENPPGRGTAYAPYPTSLRIVNWIKWFIGGVEPEPGWLDSLALQTRWLQRRLEWHLLGNHLFVNAKALVFAGLFFEGDEADAWLASGLEILGRELPEQILTDGGQFERSPMYHLLALEDLLDLLNLSQARAPQGSPAAALAPTLRKTAGRMLHWLRCMRHPVGNLVRFNDCAEGIAPTVEEIECCAAALGVRAAAAPDADGVTSLQPSGYIRVQRAPAVAWLDVAPIGPDYLPGHAHADTLSFELSLAGRELIVNRGTSVYGDGPRRLLERGTAAHSTVQLGDHDSSEVWSGFRVGRRARPVAVQIGPDTVCGSHDGYRHLPGSPVHRRRWHFASGALEVVDTVEAQPGTSIGPAWARYHLAPGLDLRSTRDDGSRWVVLDGGIELAEVHIVAGDADLEHWQHAVRFGVLVDALTLRVRLNSGQALVRWHWKS
ncbi:MAG: heparinase II/III family protein [Rubrivivax sp.]|jgi:uncharacterized heparinase superfamily protein|nr:heparinase II/III family protein [Rubrivivax sp.]